MMMSMSIQNNISGVNALQNMYKEKKEKEKEDEKLSSGYKINSAADDAAGLAISEKMRNDLTINSANQTNASMASNLVKTTEGAMQSVNDMLTRAKDLSTQASNGTYTADDRAAIQAEVDQIVSEINRVADSTNFNGIQTLDGSISAEGLDFAVDGTGNDLNLSLDGASTAINIDASQMNVTTLESAQEILATLEEFVTKITSQRGELGAMENRLNYTQNNLSTMAENLQSTESKIRDTDMAKSATESNLRSVNFQATTNTVKKAEEDRNQLLNILGS